MAYYSGKSNARCSLIHYKFPIVAIPSSVHVADPCWKYGYLSTAFDIKITGDVFSLIGFFLTGIRVHASTLMVEYWPRKRCEIMKLWVKRSRGSIIEIEFNVFARIIAGQI